MTFATPPLLAWQEPVNEAKDPGGMTGTFWPKKGRGGSVPPPTKEVGCVIVMGVWWNAMDVMVSLSVY